MFRDARNAHALASVPNLVPEFNSISLTLEKQHVLEKLYALYFSYSDSNPDDAEQFNYNYIYPLVAFGTCYAMSWGLKKIGYCQNEDEDDDEASTKTSTQKTEAVSTLSRDVAQLNRKLDMLVDALRENGQITQDGADRIQAPAPISTAAEAVPPSRVVAAETEQNVSLVL